MAQGGRRGQAEIGSAGGRGRGTSCNRCRVSSLVRLARGRTRSVRVPSGKCTSPPVGLPSTHCAPASESPFLRGDWWRVGLLEGAWLG
jgi:hypothetical protein